MFCLLNFLSGPEVGTYVVDLNLIVTTFHLHFFQMSYIF